MCNSTTKQRHPAQQAIFQLGTELYSGASRHAAGKKFDRKVSDTEARRQSGAGQDCRAWRSTVGDRTLGRVISGHRVLWQSRDFYNRTEL